MANVSSFQDHELHLQQGHACTDTRVGNNTKHNYFNGVRHSDKPLYAPCMIDMHTQAASYSCVCGKTPANLRTYLH